MHSGPTAEPSIEFELLHSELPRTILPHLDLWVQGLGLSVHGLGFRVWLWRMR